MGLSDAKTEARLKRKRRIRKKLEGTASRPRLSVFRSAKHIYAQLIDDTLGQTLASASSNEAAMRDNLEAGSKVSKAKLVGRLIGERALEKGFKQIVFDRNGFLYHGRVKALSEGAREAGLDF